MESTAPAPQPHQQVPRRTVVLVTVLFMLIVVGMGIFAYLKKQETAPGGQDLIWAAVPVQDMVAQHTYSDGEHILRGTIAVPTPCDTVFSQVFIQESYPEQVTLDVTVARPDRPCTQYVVDAPFEIRVAASEAASFHAHLQGRDVNLIFELDQ